MPWRCPLLTDPTCPTWCPTCPGRMRTGPSLHLAAQTCKRALLPYGRTLRMQWFLRAVEEAPAMNTPAAGKGHQCIRRGPLCILLMQNFYAALVQRQGLTWA